MTLAQLFDLAFGNIGRFFKEIAFKKEERGKLSYGLVGTLILVLTYGLIMLFSASYSTGYYRFKGDIYHFIRPQVILAVVGLVLMYFARDQWFVLCAGIVMLGGGMVVSACCNGLIRDHTPEGKAGLLQGIRILFQVLLPMVTGPYIGVAVIGATGMTYEELGVVKQVPTAEIFLASAAVLVLLAVPVHFLRRQVRKGAAV